MSKRFLIIGALVLALCGGLVFWNIFQNTMRASYFAHAGRPPATIEAVSVASSTWQPGIVAVGTARAQMGADLAAQAAGVIRVINFKSGDTATQGQLLVQLDDSPERADMASAQASIVADQRNFDRLTKLRKNGYATQQDWDNSRAQLDVAKSAYEHASALAALKVIKAPFGGIAGIPQVNVGQYVQVGTVIVTLQNLDAMKVDFTVPEQSSGRLEIGLPVHFGIDETGYPLTGHLIGIDPKVDPKTHLVAVQALLDNSDHKVLPGQFLRVRIDLPSEPDVLSLPQTAVITSLYGDYVYAVENDDSAKNGGKKAVQTFVQTGRREQGLIEIKSGLKAGDEVVSVGQNKLQNGAPIVVKPSSQASNSGGAQ